MRIHRACVHIHTRNPKPRKVEKKTKETKKKNQGN